MPQGACDRNRKSASKQTAVAVTEQCWSKYVLQLVVLMKVFARDYSERFADPEHNLLAFE